MSADDVSDLVRWIDRVTSDGECGEYWKAQLLKVRAKLMLSKHGSFDEWFRALPEREKIGKEPMRKGWEACAAIDAALPGVQTAPIPKNADHAAAMMRVASMWLEQNAPDVLRALMRAAPNEPAARLLPADCPICRGTGREGIPGARCFACDGTGTFMRGLAERASPQAVPADVLYDKIEQVLLHHRLSNWCMDEDGEELLPLVDRLCDEAGKDISSGKHEIRLICDAIYNEVLTKEAAPQAVDAPVAPALRDALAELWKFRAALDHMSDGGHICPGWDYHHTKRVLDAVRTALSQEPLVESQGPETSDEETEFGRAIGEYARACWHHDQAGMREGYMKLRALSQERPNAFISDPSPSE
jgi:hypothetical protein